MKNFTAGWMRFFTTSGAPIGISGVPQARDEYYSYLSNVFKLVKDEAPAEIIAQHLTDIVVNRMGLRGSTKDALEVVSVLQDWKESLDEKYN
ncbi:hypothetical protein [Rugamonas sp. DEMB1]|uniref:hypothetical protein n=1 Tax=Rugamonas sp. DEMB1 TaxID=3039386 RepID=UPI002446C16D|nr:hypothetical protein [Rugamonas sp. DEMB1]WGG53129.1 hypothetical protein QC826_14050 [Rugamonas sp. DEMB1]